jgi:hypothetical protein
MSLPRPPLSVLSAASPLRKSSKLEPVRFSMPSKVSPCASPPKAWFVRRSTLTAADEFQ